jgi:hypothetical protein
MDDLKKVFESCDVASLTRRQVVAAQVAYTLLVCSTYIAPRQAIPSIPEEIMGIVICPEKLHEYDWAGYVVTQMQTAAGRLKIDKGKNSDIYVLGGCPLAAAVSSDTCALVYFVSTSMPFWLCSAAFLMWSALLPFCDQLFCIEWVDFGAAGLETTMGPKVAVYTTDKLKELVNLLMEDGVNSEVKYKVKQG